MEVLPEAPKDWSLSNLLCMIIPFVFGLIFVLPPVITVIRIIKAGGIRKYFKEVCKGSSRSSRGGGSWGGSSGSSSSSRGSGRCV